MDFQAPASFIPKKPLGGGPQPYSGSSAFHNFFLLIAILVFVASLGAAGVAFAYQHYLTASIAQKSDSLQKAQGAFDPSVIQDLLRMDSRINNAQVLLQKHLAPSAIFDFLGTQTLQNVQFTGFDYEVDSDGSASISLTGLADSFASVALQSDQLEANKALKDVVFSNITGGQNGKISFNLKATVDPSILNYSKHLGAAPAISAPAEQGTSSPALPAATSTAAASSQ